MNVRVLGKGLELLSANGGRFEINQLLFADDRAPYEFIHIYHFMFMK